MRFLSGIAILLTLGIVGDAKTTQPDSMESIEDETVHLPCSHSAISGTEYIHWYRQVPLRGPEYVIHGLQQNTSNGMAFLAIPSDRKSSTLILPRVSLSDAAVYHCILRGPERDKVADKLVFGQGTQVIVEPKIQPLTKPSVFIMKNGTNVACLVKDFFPRDVNISLKSSKKIAEFDPAIVISPSGKYSAVKLGQYGDPNSVTCSVQHNSGTALSTDFEPHAHSPDNTKPPEQESVTQSSETCHSSKVHSKKINMTSLVVLELRMLFVKSVAINFLFSAKLLFF